jgi:hypothetical protein
MIVAPISSRMILGEALVRAVALARGTTPFLRTVGLCRPLRAVFLREATQASGVVCVSIFHAEEDTAAGLILTPCAGAVGDAGTYSHHSPDFKQHPTICQAH